MTTKKNNRGFAILVLLVPLVFVGVGGYLLYGRTARSTTPVTDTLNEVEAFRSISPSSTPFPFQEMTVPALRAREYKSSLATLQRESETNTYTAYLTSYQSDNLKVNGLLTKPKADEPEGGFPAIVFVHGYIPPESYKTQENYAAYVDYLARNGFVVFKIDLRGHGQSEGDPGGGYYSADYVVDTLNAYAALESASFVNKKKIGLWGHSMSGNILLRSFVARPSIPAIVVWAGAVYTYFDLQQFGIDDNSYRPPPSDSPQVIKRAQLREIHGNPTPESEFWKLVTPTNYLGDLKGAIQVHHAVNDTVVDIGYSRNLMRLLDNTNIVHELIEYPTGGHNINGSSFTQAMQNTVEFFKKYL